MNNEKQRHESQYAKKRARGRQMYGPGCCAHSVTPAQVAAARERARHAGRNVLPEEPAQ